MGRMKRSEMLPDRWISEMKNLFSSNIIERQDALQQLLMVDFFTVYGLMVASLMVGCWFIQKHI